MSSSFNSAGILSIPADFPIFNAWIAASTSLSNIGKLSWFDGSFTVSTDISPSALCVYSSEQYSVQRFRTSVLSVMHFPSLSCTLTIILSFFFVSSFTIW